MTVTRARFIALEGGDGAGKGAQVPLLVKALVNAGLPATSSREPGGTRIGEIIRPYLKQKLYPDLTVAQELLLFAASRVAYLHEIVVPTLAKQTWLVSDRFAASTIAYQSHGGGLDRGTVEQVVKLTLGDIHPDLTLILDVPVEIGLLRRRADAADGTRFEEKGYAFHERVRQAYLEIAAGDTDRYAIIDATVDKSTVHRAIIAELNSRFALQLKPCCGGSGH
jgi:dTMP kinase